MLSGREKSRHHRHSLWWRQIGIQVKVVRKKTSYLRVGVMVPGTSHLRSSLKYSERQSMLFQLGPGYESTDSGSDNNDVVSVWIVDGERFPPGVVIAVGEQSQARQEEPAQGEREQEVEEPANTGEHHGREQEESENFLQL